jgi:hypothetical protein
VSQASTSVKVKHQTHGAITPITGPITSVDQIYRRDNVAKGSISSFGSLSDYSDFLHTLTMSDLHKHSVEQAKVVPIDDRNRLIRRLENQWSEVCAKEGRAAPIPKRDPFSAKQVAAQDEIKRKLLRR